MSRVTEMVTMEQTMQYCDFCEAVEGEEPEAVWNNCHICDRDLCRAHRTDNDGFGSLCPECAALPERADLEDFEVYVETHREELKEAWYRAAELAAKGIKGEPVILDEVPLNS